MPAREAPQPPAALTEGEGPRAAPRRVQAGTFVILMAVASALGLAKGVVFGKILGAHALGYYGLIVIVAQFGVNFSSWGIMSALNYQLPISFGRDDPDRELTVDRSLGAVLVTSTVTGAVYLVVVACLAPRDSNTWVALSFAAAVTILTVAFEFCLLLLRVQQQLMRLGSLYLGRSVAAIVLGAAAAAVWGYRGVIGSEMTSLLLGILVARREWVRLRPRRPTVAGTTWLIRWGMPLAIANTVVTATFTVDRIFVAAALPSSLGQYTFASLVVLSWAAVLGMMSQTTAPKLLYEYGAGLEIKKLRNRALIVTGSVFAVGAVGLVVLLLARGWLRSGPFAAFGPAFTAMPILYLGGMISLVSFPGFLLGAFSPRAALSAAVLGTVFAVAGGALLAADHAGLASFAWLFTISQAVTTLAKLVMVERIVRRPADLQSDRMELGLVPKR